MTDNTINNDMTMGGATGALLAGRYRVVKQLGQGGMGSVWLAEDTKLDGFKVAIKMLPSVLVNNKRAYAQVKAEALVSLKLSHPNIATVRAFEEEGGNPFLVMDYIDGQTLDDYLADRCVTTTPSSSCPAGLPEEEVIRLLKPVAAALDYAHTQGVVHRDVKPGNIMIRKDGTPFVLDFGIAREIQETMTRVTGKLSSGTLMYMSPEQLHGAAPKPAQDIYSFAAMAYECLKGEPPFSRGQIEYQIEHDTPAALDNEFSISAGVMVGLAKQANVRPTTCVAVLAAGAKGMKGVGDGAPVRKTLIAAVLLGVLAIGALIGGGWWLGRETGKSGGRAIEPEQAVNVEPIRVATRGVESQAEKPLGSAAVRDPKIGKEPKVGDTKTITLPGGAMMEFCWCPPGSFMMGSPEDEDGRENDEMQHYVRLTKGFWIGKYEVTQRQWESVMGENPAQFKDQDRPVELVSWNDCQRFIQKVNAGGLVKVSLPTEAQWEYACRAESTTSLPNRKVLRIVGVNNAPVLDDIAWYGGNSCVGFDLKNGVDCSAFPEKQYCGSKSGTHPVGGKTANDWGLYDAIGNVSEWCQDWKGDYECDVTDPVGPRSGCERICRGGSVGCRAKHCRSANRDSAKPDFCISDLGFRLVCVAELGRLDVEK